MKKRLQKTLLLETTVFVTFHKRRARIPKTRQPKTQMKLKYERDKTECPDKKCQTTT